MTIHEYFEENILLLTVSPIVEHFQVIKRRERVREGYIKIRAILLDKSLLAIGIYCELKEDKVCLMGYRFHWQDREGNLIKRWDNVKHHSGLKTFPHHLHVGRDEEVRESFMIDLKEVLRILELDTGEFKA